MSNGFRRFVVLSLQYNKWPEVQNKLVHICFHEFQDANDIYGIDDVAVVKIRMVMVMTIKLMMMKMARLMIRIIMMKVDVDDDDDE